jgi:hypothetical protein
MDEGNLCTHWRRVSKGPGPAAQGKSGSAKALGLQRRARVGQQRPWACSAGPESPRAVHT